MTEEKKRDTNRKIKILVIVLAVIIVIAAVLLAWLLFSKKEEESAQTGSGEVVAWDVDIEEDTAGATEGIQIPGYESMVFTAGETTQSVNMGNPSDNSCYFVITLLLEDGTELFRSDYLEPGSGFETIELSRTLDAGEYTAIIQYECYSLEDESELNGASSEFQLIVQ
ncbi:MAG: hypothetical protein LUC83_03775 [Clostridiales bacterium]|nr:hypothetical protein [Clostridiales bacterium]